MDDRLTFNATGIDTLRMNWQFLRIIWKPDSFFINGQKSKLHKITVSSRHNIHYSSGMRRIADTNLLNK